MIANRLPQSVHLRDCAVYEVERVGKEALDTTTLRVYGSPQFTVAVLHGGPGAPGTMASVARDLSREWGVLEPMQTAQSVEGQIEELHAVVERTGAAPLAIIGSSWGAMLALLFTARYTTLVRKLILVGSGVYEERYAANIDGVRFSRLSEDERREALDLMESLESSLVTDKAPLMERVGALFTKTDAYDPITLETEGLPVQYETFQAVWSDAQAIRANGKFVREAARITCPVVAIHGDYDPHPPEGVSEPLSRVLPNFRFILLPHCGHLPWIERQARDEFFRIVFAELRA